MSRELEDYRAVQIDLRLLAQALGSLNDEEKTHPDKATQYDTLQKQHAWSGVKQQFSKRREAIKKHLTAKQDQRDMMYLNLSQQPLSMVSLAEVIDKLTEVETSFSLEGANNAWDKLSAFVDYLDEDEARVKELKAA